MVSSIAVIQGVPSDRSEKSGVDCQIVADKSTYSKGSMLHVKFIVTNTSETPLYLSRHLSVCSGQVGFVFFQILDKHNHDVGTWGCSADQWPAPGDRDMVNEVSDSKFWILLTYGEIYGGEEEVQLPDEKGTYRLKAELIPPAFTEKQREALVQKGTRVLQSRCPSPIVTITIN